MFKSALHKLLCKQLCVRTSSTFSTGLTIWAIITDTLIGGSFCIWDNASKKKNTAATCLSAYTNTCWLHQKVGRGMHFSAGSPSAQKWVERWVEWCGKNRGLELCYLSCMHGITNLQVLLFNSSCLDLQSNCVYLQEHLQVRGSCKNMLFLLSEQGAQWLQGKQKGRDRELSYKNS